MEFCKTIRKRMIDLDLSLSDLPAASKSSWSKWIREPQTARLEMIMFLLNYLQFEDSEQREIIDNLIRRKDDNNHYQGNRKRP